MKNTGCHKSDFKRLIIAVILGLCMCSSLSAQDAVARYADSLLENARQAPTTARKIEGLLDVSIFWIDHDTAKAYLYLAEARGKMGKSPTDFQKGLYHLYHANILMDYEPQRAKAEFSVADSLLAGDSSQKSYRYRAKLWNNYGVVLQREDKSADFMEIIIDKTLPYARLAGDSAQVGYQLQNMGMLLSNVLDYKKAAGYYKQALQTIRYLPNKEENKLYIFVNAAKNVLLMKDLDQAKSYLDSARHYVQLLPHSTSVPTFYRTELTYFRHTGKKDKALQSYQKGVSAAEKLSDDYLLMDLNFELYALYRDLGEYQRAKTFLALSHQYKHFSNVKNQALYHHEMAHLERHLGNYRSAYHQMDTLSSLLDSIYQKDVTTKVLNFEQQYKTAEKENRILRLEAENRQQELKISKTRWWALSLGCGLLLALCVTYFSWKIGKKNKKLLTQNALLHQEELRSIRQQERLRQYDAMLQGQEAERNRLAKDLHDGLGGLLAGVKLKLSSIVAKVDKGAPGRNGAVDDVIHQLDYSVDELRRIAHNMMPESLRHGGLASALSDLCRYMHTPQVQVTFQDLGIKDHYPEQLRITVYRVVQELLANAVKHADADEIILQCSELDRWLFLTVEDNGKGMELAKNDLSEGLGLTNIQNRVSLLNGHIETVSQPGEGTTVNIQIPL
ncbi:tetratricopeptide repeat-containing sensor histidine kinase [Parapedobacter indicus]|uniref:Oxygen sensor histidine kinase NreB n=1 Tax=Parapedobacter indicus TaxID=1477437 RepID=A0A1I3F1T0_9SPHI|nr:sensor histidine kinase [Parapedobacter indicus]PPL03523.1 signal transduction histidine kinase [Parapedobacter indicus]SFI05199.1 Signal transduction histidine kinase [Parapedobacter indicus]